MRELTASLVAAQQKGTGIPYVKVEAVNRFAGMVQGRWERLYSGAESEFFHAFIMANDGSMIRARISPVMDNRRLYIQRVTEPGPGSDFSSWAYTGQYGCAGVTVAASGSEVTVFLINSFGALKVIQSSDNGATWGSPYTIDYLASGDIRAFTSAVKPNGDIGLFAAVTNEVWVKERRSGNWLTKVMWNKDTGDLSGIAAAYGSDWYLVITGEDVNGNPRIWSLVYGDNGDVPAGTWTSLREIAAAASDGEFVFQQVFMDKTDACTCFFIERYTGEESYSMPFRTYSVQGTDYTDNRWLEPVPFNFQCEYGLAIARHGDYCWLSTPDGIWRSDVTELSVDLSGDVLHLKLDTEEDDDNLVIELRNDDGRYAELPEPLQPGCELRIAPGYITGQGKECSSGQSYLLESYEYVSKDGESSLFIYATGGRTRVNEWISGSQFRFNSTGNDQNILQMLGFVLSRAGLKLDVLTSSTLITGSYPDFTVYAGSSGSSVVKRLLSYVPDRLFIEGDTAYLLNPSSEDTPVYSYGPAHPVTEGRYRTSSWKLNRVTVEGYDYSQGKKILKDTFSWDQLESRQLRMMMIEDRNIHTAQSAAERGEVYLKTAGSDSVKGTIQIPVNCGQQVFDLIDITDEKTGFSSEKKRVTKISFVYTPGKGEYYQTLSLEAPE